MRKLNFKAVLQGRSPEFQTFLNVFEPSDEQRRQIEVTEATYLRERQERDLFLASIFAESMVGYTEVVVELD